MKSANEIDARRRPTPLFETEVAPVSVQIQLLGGFRVIVDGRVVPETAWRLGNARRLIQVLALAPNHSLHREQIMDLFWPDLTPNAAASNLYQVVHAARRALNAAYTPHGKPAAIIHLRQRVVTLEPPGTLEIDVETFDLAAGAARQTADPERCHEAISRYAGDLLPEQPYDEWLVGRRLALRDTVTTLLFHEARLHEDGAAWDAAIAALRRVIEIEPENEQAQADLMRVLALNGQAALALNQFKRWSEHLRRDVGEEPGDTIVLLYQDIAAGRIGPDVSSRTAPAALTNLKEPLTSFVGRQAELAEVLALARRHRLLTLTGSGGCGKSRLARAAASALADAFPDGVWWVELAARTEPESVDNAIATAVSVIEERDRPLEETLVDALRHRRLLIVLDNCEHLIERCAALCTTILESCPRVQILATSRQRLHVAGEQAWRVPSLTLPDTGAPPSAGQIHASEAVQLFIERARLAQSSFAIDAENADIIATICRRLDGIPLAIELAAARVGVLGLGQIAGRLDDTLHLLIAGNRSTSPRHQTLRAALDWGYGLLSEPQQRALAQLSVFAGGWSLDAAEAVLDDEQHGHGERQDLVLQLAEQSLVQVEPVGTGTRYHLVGSPGTELEFAL